ncbi:MAG: 50S ribosomal protein L9 [Clostridia bacterium]|nr:50S ribosomal protein L9 [Clostridia bacterium]
MKVILLQDIKDLGVKGQIVNVSDGYGKNFLIPRKLVKPATEGALNDAKEKQKAQAEKKNRELALAKEAASALNGTEVVVRMKVGENGKLFGAVSTKDIADAPKTQKELDIDRKKIDIKEPIKVLGKFECIARIYPTVTAKFTVDVRPE